MATRTIYIKDAYVAEMIEIFGARWEANIDDGEGGTIPNPQSKGNFAGKELDRGVKSYIRSRVQSHRTKTALGTVDNTEIIAEPTTTTTTTV